MMDNSNSNHNQNDSSKVKFNLNRKLDPKETAQYIADMTLELRNMAKAADLKSLKELLELCFYEGFAAANRVPLPEGELDHLRELSTASIAG